jgi:predicted nucleic acid-binding Zn ribbon protein
MKNMGPVLEQLLKKYDLWQGYLQHMVVEKWPDVVGPPLCDITRADSISRGKLKVLVKDSVWAYHLTMLKPQLINKLNQEAGSKVVKEIYFSIDSDELFTGQK